MTPDDWNDEWRCAVATLTEFERVQACRHGNETHCRLCGYDIREDM
jgi:hypothetical protein